MERVHHFGEFLLSPLLCYRKIYIVTAVTRVAKFDEIIGPKNEEFTNFAVWLALLDLT